MLYSAGAPGVPVSAGYGGAMPVRPGGVPVPAGWVKKVLRCVYVDEITASLFGGGGGGGEEGIWYFIGQ